MSTCKNEQNTDVEVKRVSSRADELITAILAEPTFDISLEISRYRYVYGNPIAYPAFPARKRRKTSINAVYTTL